jgi:hypothetical protein
MHDRSLVDGTSLENFRFGFGDVHFPQFRVHAARPSLAIMHDQELVSGLALAPVSPCGFGPSILEDLQHNLVLLGDALTCSPPDAALVSAFRVTQTSPASRYSELNVLRAADAGKKVMEQFARCGYGVAAGT